jgi:hypothetical protein
MTLSPIASTRPVVRAALLAATVLLLSPAVSSAGTYTVHACWGPEVDGWRALPRSSGLDSHLACPWTQAPAFNAGMQAYATKRAFSTGTETGWTFAAPPDTWITGFAADAAVTPNVAQIPGQYWQRGVWDANSGGLLAWSPPSPDWTPMSAQGLAATRIGIGMRCYLALCGPGIQIAGPNAGNATWDAVTFRNVTVTLRDETRPILAVSQPPPGGWQGREPSPVTFTASDNVGVRALHAFVDDTRIALLDRGCFEPSTNPLPQPCSDASAPLTAIVDPSRLAHGTHVVSLRAVDAAGNVGERSYSIRVDHNPPGAPRALTLRGGSGWRAENRFAVEWTNPPDAGESAVTIAEYELCPAANPPYDDTGCETGRVSGANLAQIDELHLPGDGEWRLRVSLRDAAGNGDLDRAATVDGLRLDREPPRAIFGTIDPLDPTRVQLNASDAMSGVGSVEIEARRQGEAIWRSLEVDERAGRFSAVIDDDQLPDGRYELRARVVDRAGNDRVTSLLDDGRPLQMLLPTRAGTSLEVGRSTRVRVKGSRGKRVRYRRVLVGRPQARFGRAVTLQGRLTDAAGNPRAAAPIEVLERVDLAAMEWRFLTMLHTDARGGFVFRATPGAARVIRFRYPGTATTRPRVDEVELRVRAGVTLVPSRGRLRNGDTIVFRGELLGRPIPEAGKLLALQALTARGWRTFATPRARRRDGRWSHRYHFTGTSATVRYAFRALAPTEASYPYAQGVSRVAHVLVYGGG